MMLRPKGSVDSNRRTYQSIPYESVKAYSIETAGMWPDMETNLELYLDLPDMTKISLGFRKGTRAQKVNIYEVGRFFSKKILKIDVPAQQLPPGALLEESESEQFIGDAIAWIGGDASQIDATEVEKNLRETVPILGINERCLMAFKVGRDTTIMTNRRLMRIDVKGVSGKAIEYLTIPYEAIKAWVVQTAGTFDLDAEMQVWTEIPGYQTFQQDLRAGYANVGQIQMVLSNMVLGVRQQAMGPMGHSMVETASNKSAQGPWDVYAWLGNDHAQVDPRAAEMAIRHQQVLQPVGEEWVEMAFSVGRDMNLLTNKRLLMIDVKNLGKKVEYKSIPYHAMHSFAFQTAGHFDGDAELMIWTGITPPPPIPPEEPKEGQPPPPPPPPQCPTQPNWEVCMSYITFDLRRGRADLWSIQQLLSAKILGYPFMRSMYPGGYPGGGAMLQETAQEVQPGNPIADLYHFMDDNAGQISPQMAQQHFVYGGILQPDEIVHLAFKLGNDFHLWTNKRFLLVDRKGPMSMGRKVLYQSIPYASIKGFAARSAGLFDSDAELEFWTDMPWMPMYEQDLRRGQINFRQIMEVLAGAVTTPRVPMPSALLEEVEAGPVRDIVGWLGGNAYEIDAAKANAEFHNEKPILMHDEVVSFACKVGRDTTMLTNKRVVMVDVQGMTGMQVYYKSIPYASVGSFEVRTAGTLDTDSEMQLYTTAPALPFIQQDFRWDKVDIFKVSDVVTTGVWTAIMRLR